MHNAAIQVKKYAGRYRAVISGTATGLAWTTTHICVVREDIDSLEPGEVTACVPGKQEPLTSWTLDTSSAPNEQTYSALRAAVERVLGNPGFRLDPMVRRGGVDRITADDASSVWMLTPLGSEHESVAVDGDHAGTIAGSWQNRGPSPQQERQDPSTRWGDVGTGTPV